MFVHRSSFHFPALRLYPRLDSTQLDATQLRSHLVSSLLSRPNSLLYIFPPVSHLLRLPQHYILVVFVRYSSPNSLAQNQTSTERSKERSSWSFLVSLALPHSTATQLARIALERVSTDSSPFSPGLARPQLYLPPSSVFIYSEGAKLPQLARLSFILHWPNDNGLGVAPRSLQLPSRIPHPNISPFQRTAHIHLVHISTLTKL